jgi:hypothetical protein
MKELFNFEAPKNSFSYLKVSILRMSIIAPFLYGLLKLIDWPNYERMFIFSFIFSLGYHLVVYCLKKTRENKVQK